MEISFAKIIDSTLFVHDKKVDERVQSMTLISTGEFFYSKREFFDRECFIKIIKFDVENMISIWTAQVSNYFSCNDVEIVEIAPEMILVNAWDRLLINTVTGTILDTKPFLWDGSRKSLGLSSCYPQPGCREIVFEYADKHTHNNLIYETVWRVESMMISSSKGTKYAYRLVYEMDHFPISHMEKGNGPTMVAFVNHQGQLHVFKGLCPATLCWAKSDMDTVTHLAFTDNQKTITATMDSITKVFSTIDGSEV